MRGHIRERSPNHWAIILDARDPQTGKRKRRWHSFKGTKREAQTRCAQLITEAEGGAAVDPSRITVAAFLARFERDWIALHTTARTAERYAGSLAHVRRHLGDRRLQALRPADLAALYATLARAGLAARTVKHVHVVIHRALGQAKLWGLVRDNCAEMAKPPAAPDLELPILQPERARFARTPARSAALPPGLARPGNGPSAQRGAGASLAGCRSRRRPSDGRTGVRANGHPRHPN